jgi:hypothetical protein
MKILLEMLMQERAQQGLSSSWRIARSPGSRRSRRLWHNSAASRSISWLVQVLAEVQGSASSTPLLRVDNKFTIALVKNPVLHEQSKHMKVKYHLVRESTENGQIKVEFIRRKEQLDDILIKPLGRVEFLELRTKIGPIDVDRHNKAYEENVRK